MTLGRADHPWSAAVERGRSTLPKAERLFGSQVSALGFLVQVFRDRDRDRLQDIGIESDAGAGELILRLFRRLTLGIETCPCPCPCLL